MKNFDTLAITSDLVPAINPESSYTMDWLEYLFCCSDEYSELDDAMKEKFETTPLYELVAYSSDDEEIAEVLELFYTCCADTIGISEGEAFCNEVGHDDLVGIVRRFLQSNAAFNGARDEEVFEAWKEVRDELQELPFKKAKEIYANSIDIDEDDWFRVDDMGEFGLCVYVDCGSDDEGSMCQVSTDNVLCVNEEGDHVDTFYFRLADKFGL